MTFLPNRHPGEGRDPSGSVRYVAEWIPAFAGMTMIFEAAYARPIDP